MVDYRIKQHPILTPKITEYIVFYWNGIPLAACKGDTISAALFANGIHVFGHHPKDQSPQGIYCATGQCAQCLVIVDGLPVKACVELIQPGNKIMPADGLPELPEVSPDLDFYDSVKLQIPVLIIGGGPAGLSAAIELGKRGIRALLIDDKHKLGGKLILQTHRFFGSTEAVYAGTRGVDIAIRLEDDLQKYPTIETWLNSTALAVFSDKKVGILKEGKEYCLVQPDVLLVACGAREKALAFKGNTLPGVYGAGAFQTLVNRDMVKPSEKIFIVGGGNVGLIAGYHALQAGIQVVGLVEALPECGGYQVHKNKLVRMGVPIYTSHTIVSANGKDRVESVTMARVDPDFRPIPGTEISFACDTVLVAVGLDPINEFCLKAKQYNLPVYSAGDAEEIAEASAAIFSGKVKAFEIAKMLSKEAEPVPEEWYRIGDILKSKPGKVVTRIENIISTGVTPVIHCTQEIPCDPCATICPKGLIIVDPGDIRKVPILRNGSETCEGCERCLAICPGLAITLVDFRKNRDEPTVSIPYEFTHASIHENDLVEIIDTNGLALGQVKVKRVIASKVYDRTIIVMVQAPKDIAHIIAGIRVQSSDVTLPMEQYVSHIADDTVICRCERVTAGEIHSLIAQGYRDINEIKAVTRAGMGACGSKTCTALLHRLFKDEHIHMNEVVEQTRRPLFIEVQLGIFAGAHVGKPKTE